MDTLLDIDDEDLKDLGVPRGHARKLLRNLQTYQCMQICANRQRALADCPATSQKHSVQKKIMDHADAADNISVAGTAPTAVADGASVGGDSILRASTPPPSPKAASEEARNIVERSWERVQEFGVERFGAMLFEEVFALDGSARELFPSEVIEKYFDWSDEPPAKDSEDPIAPKLFAKVVNLIGGAVVGVHEAQQLVPSLVRLGARHASYGVTQQHLTVLGEALVRTLRRCLDDACVPEVELAWTVVYGFVSASMLAGLTSTSTARGEGGQAAQNHPLCNKETSLVLRRHAEPHSTPTLLQRLHAREAYSSSGGFSGGE